MRAFRLLDAALGRVAAAARWLALPLALLLFLQWPLRDLVQAHSREANDAGQILFALYVSVAVTEATRRHAHLAVDAFARRLPASWRARIARFAALAVLAPWAVLVLATGAVPAWRSLAGLEGFPETTNPGYFLVRGAVVILALLVLAQAAIDAFRPRDG